MRVCVFICIYTHIIYTYIHTNYSVYLHFPETNFICINCRRRFRVIPCLVYGMLVFTYYARISGFSSISQTVWPDTWCWGNLLCKCLDAFQFAFRPKIE